jgi:hypothetical protein
MNARSESVVFAIAVLSLTIGFTTSVSADPLPGEILKFQQLPLNNAAGCLTCLPPIAPPFGAPYYGHDELSTAVLEPGTGIFRGTYMADDFADKFSTPVVHVRWWGSYMGPQTAAPPPVTKFLISFESDVPVSPNNPFSHPGSPLLNQIVTKGPLAPGSGTFTEKLLPTPIMPGMPPLEALYEYNAELHLGKEFHQERDKVYWLKIVALVDTQQTQWGWHDRDWSILDPYASTPPLVVPGEGIIGTVVDPVKGFTSPVYHFQDDAVQGPITVFPNTAMPIMPSIEQTGWTPQHYIFPWDGPDIIQQFSKDLAFELYTGIPEPSSLMLIGLGAIAVATTHRRRDD